MAHTLSARKRVRQSVRRNLRNGSRVSRIRTYIRKVEEAITSGDKVAAQTAFKVAMPEFHRGVTKGILHKNTVSRRLSRLN
ncbi:MAG: 30S ribosomal protein S20, partial [Proteobacteria bacterium]|nr:30S ribosomal protein S20 [Pseudomonadota bacterium]